jgi:putative flippase GtrA
VEGDARRKPAARQFLEYNLSACLVTAIGNVMLTGIYVERLHVHYLVANLMAIVSVGVVNFLIGECLVFRPGPPEEKKEASVCRASVLSSAPALLPPSA